MEISAGVFGQGNLRIFNLAPARLVPKLLD